MGHNCGCGCRGRFAFRNMDRKCIDIYLDWEDLEGSEQQQVQVEGGWQINKAFLQDIPTTISGSGLKMWNRLKSAWDQKKAAFHLQKRTQPKYDFSNFLTYEVPILNSMKELFVSMPQGYLAKIHPNSVSKSPVLDRIHDSQQGLMTNSFYLAYNGRLLPDGELNLPDSAYLTMFIRLLGGAKLDIPETLSEAYDAEFCLLTELPATNTGSFFYMPVAQFAKMTTDAKMNSLTRCRVEWGSSLRQSLLAAYNNPPNWGYGCHERVFSSAIQGSFQAFYDRLNQSRRPLANLMFCRLGKSRVTNAVEPVCGADVQVVFDADVVSVNDVEDAHSNSQPRPVFADYQGNQVKVVEEADGCNKQTLRDGCKIPRVIAKNGGYVVSDVSHSPYCLAGELQISTGREMKFRTFIAPRSFYNDRWSSIFMHKMVCHAISPITLLICGKKIAPEKRSIDLVCFWSIYVDRRGQNWEYLTMICEDLNKRMIPPKTVELLQMENNEYPPMQHVQYEANFLDQHRDWIDVLLEGLKDPNRYEKIELLRERPLSPSHE
uniref:Uncharacterized protein n=1 Tax=Ditylenchus dipsaci TaxID=166011 RepID=A0A915CQ47_9BILA